jgi:hypothetical protein
VPPLSGSSTKKRKRSSIHWFIDVDWGGDVDIRKSMGGYIFSLRRTLVTWSNKK